MNFLSKFTHKVTTNINNGLNIAYQTLKAMAPLSIAQKSQGIDQNILNELAFYQEFFRDEWSELYAYMALQYYKRCAPVFTAITMLSDEFASLEPCVFDKKAKKWIEDHEVLELLNHPFGDMTWEEFSKELCSYFVATGNTYLVATGRLNNPPLELINLYPPSVNILPSPVDGYAWKYLSYNPYQTFEFTRDESTGYFRFVDNGGDRKTAMRELWQIKNFNPRNRQGLGNYGMSNLTPIYYEITQHIDSSLHNIGLLENGARLSAAFETEQNLTDDQYNNLKRNIEQVYKGVLNSGKIALLDKGLKVKEFGVNNKDMDFLNLKKEVTERIYNALKIPVALMNVDRATLNNMDKSILGFYDFAVIPLANRLLKELSIFLLPRYPTKGNKNLMITFRHDKIPALRERELANVGIMQKLGIYTVNELRAMLGNDPTEGGDNVFIQNTMAPITILEDPIDDTLSSDTPTQALPKAADNQTEDQKPKPLSANEDALNEDGSEEDDLDKLSNDLHYLKFKNGNRVAVRTYQ